MYLNLGFVYGFFVGCTRVNKLGRVFSSGQPLPETTRHKIIELSEQGLRESEISRILLSRNVYAKMS